MLDENVTFNLFEAKHHPYEKKQCFWVNVIDEMVGSTMSLDEKEEKKVEEYLLHLEGQIVEQSIKLEIRRQKWMRKEKNKVELKQLPSHLKYIFLKEDYDKPIIISKSLSKLEKGKASEKLNGE
ncbi:hypothetical protein CR513_19007, partial [Mucuna pruriens]